MRPNSAASAMSRFRVRQRNEAHDRGIDLGRRPERPRGDDEETHHAEQRLQHHGEPPVFRRGRQRRHPRDHLLLQHHVHVDELRIELREAKEQRRADVVREVADDAQRRSERREVERRARRRRAASIAPGGNSDASRAARSRSISTASRCPARSISGRVSAASPGPISTRRSPGCGATASTIRAM